MLECTASEMMLIEPETTPTSSLKAISAALTAIDTQAARDFAAAVSPLTTLCPGRPCP